MEMSKTDECVTLFENNPPPARKFLQTPVFRIIRVSGGIFYFFILTEFKKNASLQSVVGFPRKKIHTDGKNRWSRCLAFSLFFPVFFLSFPHSLWNEGWIKGNRYEAAQIEILLLVFKKNATAEVKIQNKSWRNKTRSPTKKNWRKRLYENKCAAVTGQKKLKTVKMGGKGEKNVFQT